LTSFPLFRVYLKDFSFKFWCFSMKATIVIIPLCIPVVIIFVLSLLHGRALGKDAAKNVMRDGEGSVAHQKIKGLTIELKGSENGLRFLKFILLLSHVSDSIFFFYCQNECILKTVCDFLYSVMLVIQ
jgi:hypothetical protein